LTAEEVDRALPLLTALADLYLDTDPMLAVPGIARVIVDGGYTLDAVEAMLRRDVRPAFYANLLLVAGEWAGWSPEFVRERVLATSERRVGRFLAGGDRFFPRAAWAAIVAEVARLRGER